MTVVVWDGHTLAADRRGLSGGAPYAVRKIHRVGEDALAGVSGHLALGLAMVKWLQGERDTATFPKDEAEGATVLLIHRAGRIERYESSPHPIVVEEPFHASGSGREFALMALHMGADARRAVELTCELSAECGNGVDVLSFDG